MKRVDVTLGPGDLDDRGRCRVWGGRQRHEYLFSVSSRVTSASGYKSASISVFAVSFASWDEIEEMLNGRSGGKPGYSAVCVFVVGQRNEVLRLAPENAGLALEVTAFWRWSVCIQIALRSIVAVWAQAQSMAWIIQRRVEGVDSCCFALRWGGV
jgi:hypothetical protein